MNLVNQQLILYPLFAMVALVFFVLFRLGTLRVRALKARRVDMAFYKTYQGADEPDDVRAVSRHFVNLFEMPVLFYLVIVLFYLAELVSLIALLLAWTYVVLRYCHSAIHLGSNVVSLRFKFYIASCMVLLATWLLLFIQLLMRATV